MVIKAKSRGFICTTAHPVGCEQNIGNQIHYVSGMPKVKGPKNVLVIGSSTGYGLASRIVSTFSCEANTIGVFFEKPAERKGTATAGWYNSAAFERAAVAEGFYAKSINGDAFSDSIKQKTIDLIRKDLGSVDLVIYSLASPRRTDSQTGEVYKSVLKPVDQPFHSKSIDFQAREITEGVIESATDEEIRQTVKVMGGEDWMDWMTALRNAGVLSKDARTVAYSYIGPELTYPLYFHGSIGKAKAHLYDTVPQLNKLLTDLNGTAYVSVNKALVTQASAAIPIIPLYISILFRVMKDMGLHEGCVEQAYRLFADRLYSGGSVPVDKEGRIRLDDWEMREDVQQTVIGVWNRIDSANLESLADLEGYREDFFRLFGFGIPGVNYDAYIDPAVPIPSLESSQ